MRNYTFVVVCVGLLTAKGLLAVEDCTANGKDINLNNGDSTKGLSATVLCRDRDTKQKLREEKYVNGVATWMRYYEQGKISKERFLNKQGNSHGNYKEFSENGKILVDCEYNNGSEAGLCTRFFPDGKLKSKAFHGPDSRKTQLTYNEDGSLYDIECSEGGESFSPQDKEACGFKGGPSQVTLYNGTKTRPYRKVSYAKGKVLSTTEISEDGGERNHEEFAASGKTGLKVEKYKNGQVKTEKHFDLEGAPEGVQKEFAESGQVTREATFKKGRLIEEKLFYQNGQLKKHATRMEKGGKVTVPFKEFWDNGRVRRTGTYFEGEGDSTSTWEEGYRYGRRTGEFREWRENGTLESVENYQDGKPNGVSKYYGEDGKFLVRNSTFASGTLLSVKEWDPKKGLVKDEEYFPDGSRKLKK